MSDCPEDWECRFLVCRHCRGGITHPREAIGGFVVPVTELHDKTPEDIAHWRYECGRGETLTVFEVMDVDSRVRAWLFDIEWRREARELNDLLGV
jgi:hypothetical protein